MTIEDLKKRHRTLDTSNLNKKIQVIEDVHFLLKEVEQLRSSLSSAQLALRQLMSNPKGISGSYYLVD